MKGKKFIKKALTVMLCTTILGAGAAFLPQVGVQSSLAVQAATQGNYEYVNLTDGTVKITEYNGSEANVTVPSRINGRPVSVIGKHAFEFLYNLKSIVVPESVKKIDDWGIWCCPDLNKITLENKNISLSTYSICDINSDAVLYGLADSTVKNYAEKNFYSFVALNDAVKNINLSSSGVSLGKGETYVLKANILPSYAKNKSLQWRTSDKKIVTVDQKGNVRAVSNGTAWVTAKTSNGIEKSCKFTVKNAPSSVKLPKTSLTLGVGETYKFGASIPANTAAATRTFRTSNSSVVQMTKTNWEGQFKAVKTGTAYVTVRLYNGKEASCKVTVKAAPSKVTLPKTTLTLGVGETYKFGASIPANTAAATRTFRTSNSSVVKMTKTNWEGQFKAVKAGTAYVTVRLYNGREASCKVTVKAAPSKVSLKQSAVSVGVGETYKLSAVLPANTASSVRTFRTSNSSVVKMTKTNWEGQFKAVKTGTAYVTVRLYNGKEASCKVTVKAAPSKVSLNKGTLTLTVGQKGTLSAIVPNGSAASKRTFRTSNASVVKMTRTDWQGEFTAMKAGTAYVTVRLYNGKEASCKVTVVSKSTTEPTTSQSDENTSEEYVMAAFGIDCMYNVVKYPSTLHIRDITYENNIITGYGDKISRLVVCGYADNDYGNKKLVYVVVIKCAKNDHYPEAIKYKGYYINTSVHSSDPSVHERDVYVDNELSMNAYKLIFHKQVGIPFD